MRSITNPDGSCTFAVIDMHENRLYILDATVPRGAPAPGLFQVSVRFLTTKFRLVRDEWVGTQLYSNGYPPPPRTGGGRGQGQGRQGGQGQPAQRLCQGAWQGNDWRAVPGSDDSVTVLF